MSETERKVRQLPVGQTAYQHMIRNLDEGIEVCHSVAPVEIKTREAIVAITPCHCGAMLLRWEASSDG
jgi:hypothetical protein